MKRRALLFVRSPAQIALSDWLVLLRIRHHLGHRRDRRLREEQRDGGERWIAMFTEDSLRQPWH